MISRRRVLKGLAALAVGTAGFSGYALAEPFRLGITRYRISPPGWPSDLKLRIAIIADIHACSPWMTAERIRHIVQRTNALKPDATLLLGDYVVGHRLGRLAWRVSHETWARELARLEAPLGVHAVLGNHDWWDDRDAQRRRAGPVKAGLALEAAGLPVYQNDAVRLAKDGKPFWIAGLGDQWAFVPDQRDGDSEDLDYIGTDDVAATLRQVTDDAPVILMAHEPDIFPEVPARVALTVAGHTHGGQVRFGHYAPVVPSKYGRRYVYGHIVEANRHLVVSAGLGCSGLPVRFGAPPEIVLIDLAMPEPMA